MAKIEGTPNFSTIQADPNIHEFHTVEYGDSLWSIASMYYGNPFYWPNIYKNNTNMIKFFHSITNDNPVKEFNDGFVDIYKIVSPGIVYFIGNKYIIMRCPEIEAHLYRSLSKLKIVTKMYLRTLVLFI